MTDAAASDRGGGAGTVGAVETMGVHSAAKPDWCCPYCDIVAGLLDACGGCHVAYRGESRPWGGW